MNGFHTSMSFSILTKGDDIRAETAITATWFAKPRPHGPEFNHVRGKQKYTSGIPGSMGTRSSSPKAPAPTS